VQVIYFDQFDNVGSEGSDSMNAALTALDDAYSEFLLNDKREELMISSGDELAAAMRAGMYWSEFLEARK
jgi:hypothetical protein